MGELRQIYKILNGSDIKYDKSYSSERLRHLAHLATIKINSKSECFGYRDLNDRGWSDGKCPCMDDICNAWQLCQELTDYNNKIDMVVVSEVSSNQTFLPERPAKRSSRMSVEKDKFGLRVGSKSSKIAEILTTNMDLTRTKAVELVMAANNVTDNTANVQIYTVKKKLAEQGIKIDFKRGPRKPKAKLVEAPAAPAAPAETPKA